MSGEGIQYGEAAGLAACRVKNEQQTALLQILVDDEVILLGPIGVTAQFHGDDDDDDEGAAAAVDGQFVTTSERLLFWGSAGEAGNNGLSAAHDLRVGAESIDLHALTDALPDGNDSACAYYVQLSNDDDAGDGTFFELTLAPSHQQQPQQEQQQQAIEQTQHQVCQQIFDAITKLISLHPIDPNELNEPSDNDGAGCWFGEGPIMTAVGDEDDELIVCASSTNSADATERAAMLERLDNLLIVPPELEQLDGQFDDADEDDDSLL